MDSLAVAFLGVIALSSLVQAGMLVGLSVQGRRLARQVGELQQRIEHEIQPSLAHLKRVARNAAEVSDIAVLEARRVDAALATLGDRLEDVSRLTQKLLLRPLRPVAEVAALLRGLRRGLDVYHRLKHFGGSPRHPERSRRRRSAQPEDDEHLFI
jgi:hypothetical protein